MGSHRNMWSRHPPFPKTLKGDTGRSNAVSQTLGTRSAWGSGKFWRPRAEPANSRLATCGRPEGHIWENCVSMTEEMRAGHGRPQTAWQKQRWEHKSDSSLQAREQVHSTLLRTREFCELMSQREGTKLMSLEFVRWVTIMHIFKIDGY
jgi:hypothetical protein